MLICKLKGLPDPRTEGSKNPGATNVMRLGGKWLALLTLVGDALKGFIPVAIAMYFYPKANVVGPVMLFAFLGHLYPVFFNFQGGKGVATLVGTLFAMNWLVGVLFLIIWGLVFFLSRISSLSAIIASILVPFFTYLEMSRIYAFFVAIMSLFILWRHRSNIQRLLKGTEPKMGKLASK